MGVDVERVGNYPDFLIQMNRKALDSEGLTTGKTNNPFLKEAILEEIQKYKQNKLEKGGKKDPPERVSDASPVGRYDYLRDTRPDDGNGKPQINLAEREMKIGALSASEYFALKADPVLATQQPIMAVAPTPVLAQKPMQQQTVLA